MVYRYHSFYRSLAIISSQSLKLWNKKWILKPQAYSVGNPGAGVSVAAVASPHDDLVNQWENHGFLDEIRCWMTWCRIHPMPCLPSSTSPFFGGIPKPSPTLVVVAGFPYSLFILVTINRKKCFWLVASTICQWEGLSHILWKIKFMFETTNQIYYSPCFCPSTSMFFRPPLPFAPRCHEIHQVRHLLLRPLLRLQMAIGEHHFSIYRF